MAQSTTKKKTSQSRSKSTGTSNSTKRKSSTSKPSAKTSTTRQTRQTSRPVRRKKKRNPFTDEITLIVTAVVSILLILSNFNLGGQLSNYINDIVFGLMGLFARVFPFVLFFGVAFGLSNRGNTVAKRKLYSSIGFAAVFLGLLQLISYPDIHMSEIGQAYGLCATDKVGGGIIGSLLSAPLVTLVGKIGAYVVLLALLAILFVFVTEIYIFSTLGKKGVEHFHEMRERKALEEDEFDDYYDDELDEMEEELQIHKRRAKTFTFDREDLEDGEMEQEQAHKEKKPSRGRKKKGASLFELKPEETVETEETKAKTIDFPIHRANPMEASNEVPFEVEEPIYKKELRSKFDFSEEEPDPFLVKEEPVVGEAEEITITHQPSAMEEENTGFEPAMEETDMIFDEAESEPSHHEIEAAFSNDLFDEEEDDLEADPFHQEVEHVIPTMYVDDSTDVVEHHQGFVMPTKMEQQAEDELIRVGKYDKPKASHTRSHAKTSSSETAVEELKIDMTPVKHEHEFPPINLLTKQKSSAAGASDRELKETALKLQSTLDSFGVKVTITNVSCGPAVTRYELQPEQGVKVSRITNLADDIKLNLAAADIRIEAPIPGKAAVGIEVPNKVNSMVTFRELIESTEFQGHDSEIAFAVGKDISGQTVVTDIAKMPHLLIAGATGSGKSVCINTLIMSILYKASPEDVKLIMVDPKVVELNIYNGIPHLLIPVVTDPKKASAALNWAVAEMTDRYKKFAQLGVRDMKGYNKKVEAMGDDKDENFVKLPQIVIIVDELADLMMVASNEVEDAICRLAQMARAAGIHLIIATQRPSVNVITGLIKANVPSRIAFSVSSAIDSRTIIDGSGAEKLLGKGDMLFFPSGYPKPVRIQGAFVSDKEVSSVVEFLKEQYDGTVQVSDLESKITAIASSETEKGKESAYDDIFAECGKFIIEKDKASIGMLQRMFKIGYNRAARIMDQLYDAGVVGPDVGTKPRTVLMSMEEFELYIEEYI